MFRSIAPLVPLTLAACSGFSWPSAPASCDVLDTWSIQCDCVGVYRGDPGVTFALRDSLESCELDHDDNGSLVPGALAQACSRIALQAAVLEPDFRW